ncbi:MAG: energy transducer TonB [Maribacter sp.]|nr:energy transducer TonB [Maribacter sp.]
MKKSIIIFCAVVAILSLTAFGILNWEEGAIVQPAVSEIEVVASVLPEERKIKKRTFPDFIYDVGPRFGPIKKSDLAKARTFEDFISEEHAKRIVTYKSLSVIYIINDEQSKLMETGYSKTLTAAQLKFLQTADYSTNFIVRAEYQEKNKETGDLEDSYSTPHRTIVPEKQAVYASGKDVLIEYLKEKSKEARKDVLVDELQPAKLFFTVTKNGTIENVKLDRTSNYPDVDKKMIELIKNAPGTWEAAENAQGEKVDQELVISFGLQGC